MKKAIDIEKFPNLTWRKHNALGKIFACDLHPSQKLFQSKAKIYNELEADGYVEFHEDVTGKPGVITFTVKYWALTLLGHYAYCANC